VTAIKDNYISYPEYINKDELINKLNEIYSDKNYYISNDTELIDDLTFIYQNYIGDISAYNILDIGCNIGTYCFSSYYNKAKYIEGIDLNSNLIDIANETKNKLNINDTSIKFINSDIFDIDFKNKKFDIILYFNNIFQSSQFNNYKFNLNFYKMLHYLIKYNKYFIIGSCFKEQENYFDKFLTVKYDKFTHKNMILYQKRK